MKKKLIFILLLAFGKISYSQTLTLSNTNPNFNAEVTMLGYSILHSCPPCSLQSYVVGLPPITGYQFYPDPCNFDLNRGWFIAPTTGLGCASMLTDFVWTDAVVYITGGGACTGGVPLNTTVSVGLPSSICINPLGEPAVVSGVLGTCPFTVTWTVSLSGDVTVRVLP